MTTLDKLKIAVEKGFKYNPETPEEARNCYLENKEKYHIIN